MELIRRIWSEIQLVYHAQRDVIVLFLIAVSLNIVLWLMHWFWYPFDPSIAWYGSGSIAANGVLSLLFSRKGHVFAQALAVTAVVAQLLLLTLIIRTATVLL